MTPFQSEKLIQISRTEKKQFMTGVAVINYIF